MDLNKDEVAKLSFSELLAMTEYASKEATRWKTEHQMKIYERDIERRSIYWEYLHGNLQGEIQNRCDLVANRTWDQVK